jgi:hypothetical protein
MARKYEEIKSTIADAVSSAIGELTALAEEVREVVDNASGGLENTPRIQTLDETATALEEIEDIEIDERIGKLEISYNQEKSNRKGRGLSRASRRDNAVQIFDAVLEKLGELEPQESNDNEPDYTSLINDLEVIKENAEGVEFPGMFG